MRLGEARNRRWTHLLAENIAACMNDSGLWNFASAMPPTASPSGDSSLFSMCLRGATEWGAEEVGWSADEVEQPRRWLSSRPDTVSRRHEAPRGTGWGYCWTFPGSAVRFGPILGSEDGLGGELRSFLLGRRMRMCSGGRWTREARTRARRACKNHFFSWISILGLE
jgi:hypothetical protein